MLRDLIDKLGSPERIGCVVVNDSHVTNVERNILLIRRHEDDRFT